VYIWNLFGLKRFKWEGPDALTPGKHILEFDFKYDGLGAATLQYGSPSGLGQSGTGYLKVDGVVVATQKMEKTVPMLMQWCESFDVGADTGSPVDDKDYEVPFRFTGKLDKLTLTIDRPKLSPEDIKKLKAAIHANPASE
jgi:arylsulfatase